MWQRLYGPWKLMLHKKNSRVANNAVALLLHTFSVCRSQNWRKVAGSPNDFDHRQHFRHNAPQSWSSNRGAWKWSWGKMDYSVQSMNRSFIWRSHNASIFTMFRAVVAAAWYVELNFVWTTCRSKSLNVWLIMKAFWVWCTNTGIICTHWLWKSKMTKITHNNVIA